MIRARSIAVADTHPYDVDGCDGTVRRIRTEPLYEVTLELQCDAAAVAELFALLKRSGVDARDYPTACRMLPGGPAVLGELEDE